MNGVCDMDWEPEPIQTENEAALRLYLKLGSLAAVSREMEIPIYELQKLSRTDWWQTETILIRRAEQAALDARLTKLLGKTLDELEDRLENGEIRYTKKGESYKAQLSASVICRIAETVFDKRQLVRNLPTQINEGSKLQELADKLEALGKAQAMKTLPSPDGHQVQPEDDTSFEL